MIRTIILVLVLILVFSYFGISLRDVATSPTGQDNFAFVWAYIQNGWDLFLQFLRETFQQNTI